MVLLLDSEGKTIAWYYVAPGKGLMSMIKKALYVVRPAGRTTNKKGEQILPFFMAFF